MINIVHSCVHQESHILYIHMFFFTYLSIYRSIFLFFFLSFCRSIFLFLSIYLSIYLSFCLSVVLSFFPLGLHSARYLNFRKAATCSHSQPLEWPQVAASGRSVEWPQVTASGRLRRVAEVCQSHKKQPLAATRVAANALKIRLGRILTIRL